jgi:L-iditol 2-dehydrogenase
MIDKRLSLHWISKKKIELRTSKIPKINKYEMLLKVESCAICGSDLKIFYHGNKRVKSGQIIGHEIAGKIIDIGSKVKNFKVGDNVSIGADTSCGKKSCQYCMNGNENCCDTNYAIGHQFEGGFTQYMKINQLVSKYGPISKFSKNISYDEVSLSEPLACCINGFEKVNFKKKGVLLILGAGPIGYLLASLGRLYECKNIILADYSESRLNFARSNLSRIVTVNLKKENLFKRIKKITKNKFCDYIFTANNSIESQKISISVVGKSGKINFFGGIPGKDCKNLLIDSNIIHYKEIVLTGSHGSTALQHKKALKLIISRKINVKALITHRYKLTDVKKAYEKAISGKAMKIIIKPHV